MQKPYAVVECKRDGVTDAEFLQAIEQGVGNATWVKLRASYVVIIAGATRRVLDFSDDSTGILERENNIIADLPKAYGKPQAFRFYRGGEYTDVDGKKKKAPDIQPVAREDLITAIKKCHNTLWGGGRLSPPTAFGELCKLIFVKISDEQKPRKKENRISSRSKRTSLLPSWRNVSTRFTMSRKSKTRKYSRIQSRSMTASSVQSYLTLSL